MKFLSTFALLSCTLSGFISATPPAFTERFRWSPANYSFEEAGLQVNRTAYDFWDFAIDKVRPWKDKLFLIQTRLNTWTESRMVPMAYVNLSTTDKSPPLFPYPKDLVADSLYSEVNHSISIGTVKVDTCDRLWFTNDPNQTLYIVDLIQSKIIRTVQLNYSNALSMTVDVNKSDCQNAYAYIVDYRKQVFFVYRYKDHKYWKTRAPSPKKEESKFSKLTMYYSALSNIDGKGNRVLFVQLLNPAYLIGFSTDSLRNSENINSPLEFTVLGCQHYKSSIIHYDEISSVLFFSDHYHSSLGCWNTKRFPNEFSANTTDLIIPSNMRISYVWDIQSDEQNNLLVLDSVQRSINYHRLYLYTANIKNLVNGTVCDLV